MSDFVTYKDMGLQEIYKSVAKMDQMDILIGYIGEDGSMNHPEAAMSVATLAAIHEFGTDDIPERSFMRSTMIEQQTEIANLLAAAVLQVIMEGEDPYDAYAEIAQNIAKMVSEKLGRSASWATQLKEKTVNAKGSNTPLDKTGTLKKNLGWAVTFNGIIQRQGRA